MSSTVMVARRSLFGLRRAISLSSVTPAVGSAGSGTGMGNSRPSASRMSSTTLRWSSRPMKRSRGENAPVASSSRSHIARGESWTEGRVAACDLSSAASSAPTVRSTSSPP